LSTVGLELLRASSDRPRRRKMKNVYAGLPKSLFQEPKYNKGGKNLSASEKMAAIILYLNKFGRDGRSPTDIQHHCCATVQKYDEILNILLRLCSLDPPIIEMVPISTRNKTFRLTQEGFDIIPILEKMKFLFLHIDLDEERYSG
jgi:hypothetical protein